MKKILFVICLLLVTFSVTAQDTLDFPIGDDDITLSIPDGWTFEETDAGFNLTQEDTMIKYILIELAEDTTPESVFASATDGQDVEINDEEIFMGWTTTTDSHSLAIIPVNDSFWLLVIATEDTLDVALSIFQFPGFEASNCFVTVQQADVRVRVGPGFNRSTLTFLPIGGEYSVIGKAVADDETQWWKLDPEEAIPDSATEQAWVNQADVVDNGECDAVIDVNAPPIIPALPVLPPTTPGSSEEGDENTVAGPTVIGEFDINNLGPITTTMEFPRMVRFGDTYGLTDDFYFDQNDTLLVYSRCSGENCRGPFTFSLAGENTWLSATLTDWLYIKFYAPDYAIYYKWNPKDGLSIILVLDNFLESEG